MGSLNQLKMFTFEQYLEGVHAMDYTGNDDHMSDDFNDWLSDLDGEEYLAYGEEYGIYLTKKLKQ